MFMLVLVSLYTANMAAFFSNDEFYRPLSSVHEIVDSDREAFSFDLSRKDPRVQGNAIIGKLINSSRLHYPLEVIYI